MANLSMRYETILVFKSALGEEAVAALVEKFKSLIAANATTEKVEEWGKRKLAYPIEDETEGHYLLVHFESKPDFPAELNRVLEITEGVLRSLIVRNEVEPGKEVAQPAPISAAPVAAAQEESPAPPAPEPTPIPEATE